MRADDDPEPLGREARIGPKGTDPAADERDLVGRDEEGRADVEEEGRLRPDADPALELFRRPARRALEPLVELLGARHDGAPAVDPVQLLELAPLHLVPDEHPIRREAEHPLVREVVPARDTGPGRDAEPARALQVVDLVRGVLDERRREHDVWVERAT